MEEEIHVFIHTTSRNSLCTTNVVGKPEDWTRIYYIDYNAT